MSDLSIVAELHGDHVCSQFESGVDGVDRYLRNEAQKAHRSGDTRTWVLSDGDGSVMGYYTLRITLLQQDTSGPRFTSQTAPGFMLAKLGITRSRQNQGFGTELLADAVSRMANASDLVGGRFIIVDADLGAFDFYAKYDFVPFDAPSTRLYMPLDVARAVRDGA